MLCIEPFIDTLCIYYSHVYTFYVNIFWSVKYSSSVSGTLFFFFADACKKDVLR